MSDTTLNRFLGELSTAGLAAFTPSPPTAASGPDYLYLIRNSDDNSLNYWDGSAWQNLTSGASFSAPATSVVATTSANITIATALNNGDTLDGVTLATGDLVLVKNQTTNSQNGIYVVGTSPARDTDYSTYDAHAGKIISVQQGTLNADTVWYCSSNEGGGTIDSDPILFVSLQSVLGTTNKRTLDFLIDGGGSAITTGIKGFVQVPFTGTITGWTLLSTDAASTAGTIVIDVWKDTYANYPPTVADTITASAKPSLTAASKNTDTVLTGWTTAVTAGDIFGFKVDSASTVTKVLLQITITS